jgi:hypothetical protein
VVESLLHKKQKYKQTCCDRLLWQEKCAVFHSREGFLRKKAFLCDRKRHRLGGKEPLISQDDPAATSLMVVSISGLKKQTCCSRTGKKEFSAGDNPAE